MKCIDFGKGVFFHGKLQKRNETDAANFLHVLTTTSFFLKIIEARKPNY